jgi:deoxyribonuclease V
VGGGLLYDMKTKTKIDFKIGKLIPIPYPYIRGFLSLRNKKPLLHVISQVQGFDFLLVEGAGKQHPRQFGLACELGVELDLPTIGITRTSLWGKVDYSSFVKKQLGEKTFEIYPVKDEERHLAYFVKKKHQKKGIFVSVGHKISLKTGTEIILPLIVNRLPEPLRLVKSLIRTAI